VGNGGQQREGPDARRGERRLQRGQRDVDSIAGSGPTK
jgi:hypothetical protein